MTVAQIRKRIEYIEQVSDDPESAHYEQDQLLFDVLRAISKNPANAQALARATMDVRDVRFPRWYA